MENRHFLASPIQKQFWFLQQLSRSTSAYHVPSLFKVKGLLNKTVLKQSLECIVDRYSVLRTRFMYGEQGLAQFVSEQGNITLNEIVIDSDIFNDNERIEALVKPFIVKPFDLEKDNLFRTFLFDAGNQNYLLLFVMHHIICDLQTKDLFSIELESLYSQICSGIKVGFKPVVEYVEYSNWYEGWLKSDACEKAKVYWKEQLKNAPAECMLPLDKIRPAVISHKGSIEKMFFTKKLTGELIAFSERHTTKPYLVMLSAYILLLGKNSGQKSITVGVPLTNRKAEQFSRMPGCCVNIIPLHIDLSGNPTVIELLRKVRMAMLGAYRHQELPFQQIVDVVNPERKTNLNPLFQAGFTFEHPMQLKIDKCTIEPIYVHRGDAQLDLFATFWHEREDELTGVFEYNTDLFSRDIIQQLQRSFLHIIEQFVMDGLTDIRALQILAPYDYKKICFDWNNTNRAYSLDKCIQVFFEEQVEKTPDAPALTFEGRTLSYREMNNRVNQLSHFLISEGVGPECLVGVCAYRSINMVIAILSVVKAGGAYVPIDPTYPEKRISFIIDDTRIPIVLTHKRCGALLEKSPVKIIYFEDVEDTLSSYPTANPPITTKPENLAYVIYTSGSTGNPKGVMNSHKGLTNRLLWMQDTFSIGVGDALVQKTPFTFDVSVWEFFWPFMYGARLVVARPDGHKDVNYLQELIERENITIIHFVPSMLRMFLMNVDRVRCRSLKHVIASGEAITVDLQKIFYKSLDIPLHNLYGPTEAAIDVSYWKCDPAFSKTSVPIGRPISNVQLYILDETLQPVQVGVCGELYIGGVQVARGYLNRPELTAEKFIEDPFAGENAGRLYKTGDLCRFLPDGIIEYVGRIDFQVKIRGNRIELGEIETAVLDNRTVRECVVIAREDIAGDLRLVAYVVVDKSNFSLTELKKNIRERLPDYMVPTSFVEMEAFPLTDSGKLDRKRLPKPVKIRPQLQQTYRAAATELEKRLVTEWCNVLGLDTAGIQDNFFDLGGNSFLAIQLINNLHERFGITIPVLKIFELSSVEKIAAYLESNAEPQAIPVNQAAISELQERKRSPENGIAVIGMAGRFPGAPNIDSFWENLCKGVESVKHFSRQELINAGIAPEVLDNPNYIKSAPIIDDADCFDAAFFGYNQEDAFAMDPQHRLFLESCWSAIENAGYNPDEYAGKIGVFGGCSMNFYFFKNVFSNKDLKKPLESFIAMLGNEKDFLTTKVSYCLNLTGPSINVQTGCSTSLVAVHLACQSLLNNECDMALVGGATVRVPQMEGYFYTEGLIASKDGHCRTFDENASGTIFGEGVGVVLLKRHQDALKDADTIDAVILGTAINNDGSSKVGYTAPSVNGQRDVIESAYAKANVEPKEISYIEAHGTGTSLGDCIELKALAEVFNANSGKHCALGSLKPNIGHLDAAAGIAGLIKTVLVLKNRKVPPVINVRNINPKLELEKTPFYINKECIDLVPSPLSEHPERLLAGVSSFGVGGTNAHALLQAENGTSTSVVNSDKGVYILPCSAKTSGSLQGNLAKLGRFLRSNKTIPMVDCAYTLLMGRKQFPYRDVVVTNSTIGAGEQFEKLSSQHNSKKVFSHPSITFMFTGQGSQYVNMGKKLYENEPLFKHHINECVRFINKVMGIDILSHMFTEGEPSIEMNEYLKRTEVTQPALFAIEYSLAQVLIAWGIRPDRLIGHSVGEYVAATISGVFTLEQATEIICMRGKLMQSMPEGAMLAVSLPAEGAAAYCNKTIWLAVVNSPAHSVLAGPTDAIHALNEELKLKKVQATVLKTSHAFHSPMMGSAADAFVKHLASMHFNKPLTPFLSNVTGDYITDDEAVSARYWGNHIRNTVLFSDGIKKLLQKKEQIMIEVGPGNTLCSLVKMQEMDGDAFFITPLLPTFQVAEDAQVHFLQSVGKVWAHGGTVALECIADVSTGRRVHLPTYSFEKTRYWIEADIVHNEPVKKSTKKETREVGSSDKNNDGKKDSVIDVTQAVITMWKDLLGVDTVSVDSNYFDLGGTSLQALRLFEQIEKRFGVYLPVGSLISAPTVEQLVKLIDKKESHQQSWSLVVPIRSKGTKKPLFLVHGGGGNVLLYRELAMSLPENQPVYGIQALGLNGKDAILTTIEEMAELYVKEIKMVDPVGPYYLGGYCLGGTIIYEMAQRLTAEGREVALVAMFDTSREWFELTRAERFRFLVDNIGFHIRNIAQASPKGKMDFIKERSIEALRRINRKLTVIQSQILHKAGIRKEPPLIIMETVNDAAAMKYVAKPYSGKITVFKPKAVSDIVDPYLGWKSVETGGVDLVNLSAYRNGILISPFVKELADEVAKRLEK